MMEDLAMHVLELLMNSLEHNASRIEIFIYSSEAKNRIYFKISDDGDGMALDMSVKAVDSFVTTRTTRKVGMGLAFMKSLCDYTNGSYHIKSKLNEGTSISFDVQKDHIDLPPLGDMGEMVMFAFVKKPDISLRFEYKTDDDSFNFDTIKLNEEIEDLSYDNPEVQLWIKKYINEGIDSIK